MPSAAIIKGHRRTLSGCMPMVGLGVVAWSSLRDLESSPQTFHHPITAGLVRTKSPEGKETSNLFPEPCLILLMLICL